MNALNWLETMSGFADGETVFNSRDQNCASRIASALERRVVAIRKIKTGGTASGPAPPHCSDCLIELAIEESFF